MGWNFRKSITIFPWITLNFGTNGFSGISIGPKNLKLNIGRNGKRITTSIPGTGIYYTKRKK